jgi:UDPglucose 6-dehydrogenase
VQALQRTARHHGIELRIVNAAEEANNLQKEVLFQKITAKFGENLKGMRFALWGLAFKPNTDDMREAPSRVLIEGLWRRGATVAAYDPVAMDETRRIYGDKPGLTLCQSAMQTLPGADALVIVTEWKEFRSPDFSAIKNALKNPVIFDGRNLYEPKAVRAEGIEYYPIGRQ